MGCGGHVFCSERVSKVGVLQLREGLGEFEIGLLFEGALCLLCRSCIGGVEGVDDESVVWSGGDFDGWA